MSRIFGSGKHQLDLLLSLESARLAEMPKVHIGQIECSPGTIARAALIAPAKADAFMGVPIRENSALPDGYMMFLDREGNLIGVYCPDPDAGTPVRRKLP